MSGQGGPFVTLGRFTLFLRSDSGFDHGDSGTLATGIVVLYDNFSINPLNGSP